MPEEMRYPLISLVVLAVVALSALAHTVDPADEGRKGQRGDAVAEFADVPMAYQVGNGEQESFGPSALRYAPNGTFWIINPADNSITNVSKGRIRRQFRFASDAVGLTDLRVMPDSALEALDSSASPARLLTISESGEVLGRRNLVPSHEVSGSRPLTSMVIDAGREPIDELAAWHAGPTFEEWTLKPGTDVSPDATIEGPSCLILVKADQGVIRGLEVLSVQKNGIYVLVDEVVDGTPMTVDSTVRRYTSSGEFISMGRVPLAQQYTWVAKPVAVTGAGEVYVLVTKPGAASVDKLTMTATLDSILPPREERSPHIIAMDLQTPVLDASTIQRSQVLANARVYLNNSTYYNESALRGTCSNREAPRYLVGKKPGYVTSVPYAWGHAESVSAFNGAIASGVQAGDIDLANDGKVLSCVRGVDCSGYVSNVLGTPRLTTDNLNSSSWSSVIATSSLSPGDMFVRAKSGGVAGHVVLVDKVSASGVSLYEATTNDQVDRVRSITSPWSRFNTGWNPRRYTGMAVTAAMPALVSASFSPTSLTLGKVVTFETVAKNDDGFQMSATLTLKQPSGSTLDYAMPFSTGYYASGATFRYGATPKTKGSYGWAVTVQCPKTGKTSRYPGTGYFPGPTVK